MKLTREIRNRRLEVIKDAIKQIREEKLRIQCGSYWEIIAPEPSEYSYARIAATKAEINSIIERSDGKLQDCISEIMPYCHVCARGALLASKIRKYNNVPAHVVFTQSGGTRVWQETTTEYLGDIFDARTLLQVEIAFECRIGLGDFRLVDEEETYALAGAYEGIEDDADRLLAILDDMVRNDGEFILP